MTRGKIQKYGNGKRHRIPLFKGLELKKLLIIGEIRFKVLEDYVKKSLFFYKRRKNRKNPELKIVPVQDNHKFKRAYNRQPYEASKIWVTRDSSFWQWRRVREWFSQFKESYEIQ